MGQGDVDLHKVKETGQGTALTQPGPGLLAPGLGAPNDPLLLGKGAPPGGDSAENPADRHLGGRAGIKRDKGSIRVLAIAIALPDSVPALIRFRNLQNSHNRFTGDPYHLEQRLSVTFSWPGRRGRAKESPSALKVSMVSTPPARRLEGHRLALPRRRIKRGFLWTNV